MDGGLIIDKPPGLTSHDVVDRVRRALKIRRIGHTGTLDPFATGVLVLCIGRATRLSQFLVGADKTYEATVRLGFATDTQDATGQPISPLISSEQMSEDFLRRVLAGFRGCQLQMPPMYSAKKVRGVALHRLARRGEEVGREPVEIVIFEIELLPFAEDEVKRNVDGTLDFRMRVRCSSGTYIRTLAHDIGQRLGTGAHLVELRRTAVGPFTVDDAIRLEALEEMRGSAGASAAILPMAELLPGMPVVLLDGPDARRIRNGEPISISRDSLRVERFFKLCDKAGQLLAIAEYNAGKSQLQPRVVVADTLK